MSYWLDLPGPIRISIESYKRKIRNPVKKAYAIALIQSMNFAGPDPDIRKWNLSGMARQAVRLEISRLIKGDS